jgi:competence protein ComEA
VFSSSLGKGETLTIAKSPTASDVPKDIKSPKIFVHVAGSVKSPGIYKLDSGTRVFDAVLAAGGFTAKANQASVNMARALNDGEQLLVSSQQVGGQTIESPMSSSLISLNQASAAQLEELPGVGPALAGRMIDWRTANGGFKAKEDLLNVAGIGDKLFASVKDLVTL